MSARLSVCLVVALFSAALATPSAAETFIVNGAFVEDVEGLDRSILDYAENYPPPTPAHAMSLGHPRAARFRRSAAVLSYERPCLLSDGQTAIAVSCRMVPHLVGEPLD